MTAEAQFRKTTQRLMPLEVERTEPGQYNIYPSYPLNSGKIEAGYGALAEKIVQQSQSTIILDGFPGVLWEKVRQQLTEALISRKVKAAWHNIDQALLSPEQIDKMIAPFLGGDDPLFGYRFSGSLRDFFDPERLSSMTLEPEADLNILYGTGAALSGWQGLLIYFDIPKNEIQFRARSKSVKNLAPNSRLPLNQPINAATLSIG